jgi:hypothetical protein
MKKSQESRVMSHESKAKSEFLFLTPDSETPRLVNVCREG